MGNIGEDLADLDDASGPSPSHVAPKRDQTTGKFINPAEKSPEKQKEVPKPEEKAPEIPEPERPAEEERPSNMRQLGKKYDELKKERDTVLQPKIQSLEAKTKEYERAIEELRTKQPDLKPFQEKMAALEKERAQLLEIVRHADYEKSPEYQEKYVTPYNEAWAKALWEVTQLSKTSEDGTIRRATENDLLALANASLDDMDDLAAQWFPKSAARVIRHVEKIRDLADAQEKAKAEAKKGATEFETKRKQEFEQADTTFRSTYQGVTTDLPKKYPKIFGTDETDAQGNDLLKKGLEFADTVFSPNGNQLPAEKKAARLALIRFKAANHDRLFSRLKARDARIAELEASLKQYEDSGPPTDDAGQPGTGESDGTGMDAVEAELRKLDK
jgi:hypothetical protein